MPYRDINGTGLLFEHRFWLQILGDHARFITNSLAHAEKIEIERAQSFITAFDQLLDQARTLPQTADLSSFNRNVYGHVSELRKFKLHLLERRLTGNVKSSLPASFYNHMINELDEYMTILRYILEGKRLPVFAALHHHLLWLDDAVGHAGAIGSSVDLVETSLRRMSSDFEKSFQHFYYEAVQLAGFLRTNLHKFPALARFNKQVELEMLLFIEFLNELKEMGLKAEELGTLAPLMADHMAREECYYLTKLSQVSEVLPPKCDPTHERVDV